MPLVKREMQIVKTTLTPQPEWLYQESKRHHQSGKQEGNLHSPVSPPNPAPSLIPSFTAGHLLQPPLLLWSGSQRTFLSL